MEASTPSIVVFSRGRPGHLRRLFSYHAGYPGQLVILDGSADPLESASIPRNVEYHHMPDAPIYRRIAEGLSRVTASTCVLSADDDYVVHDGLRACGHAIDSDHGISCAAGTVVYFSGDRRAPRDAIADGAIERILEVPPFPDPARRFGAVVSTGPHVLYACMRTSVALRVSATLADLSDEDGLVGEQLWGPLASLFGRVAFVDRLQLCRRKAQRDYSDYLAAFRALDDVAEWSRFGEFSSRFRRLAIEAGADVSGADAVIESWRAYASSTSRGERAWARRRLPASVRARRIARNLLSNAGVVTSPMAWVDRDVRAVARNRSARITLRALAYPWSDPAARADYARIMAFDAQQAAPAAAT
jgi:glycosyltransferase domain-containing protein